jgi:ADP-ribose pyrophosphatase
VPQRGPFFLPAEEGGGVEILGREVAYGGFFRIERFRIRHRLFAGGWSRELGREVFERHNAVGLLLYDPERDSLVLVEQFRLPAHLAGLSPWQVEIVAGIIDTEESAEEVARREALEEAGLAVGGALVPIHRFLPSPGGSTETVTLYCGRVDSRGAAGIHGLADEGEDIRVVVKTYREAMALLREGVIENAFTLIALYWLKSHRARLRRAWGRAAP